MSNLYSSSPMKKGESCYGCLRYVMCPEILGAQTLVASMTAVNGSSIFCKAFVTASLSGPSNSAIIFLSGVQQYAALNFTSLIPFSESNFGVPRTQAETLVFSVLGTSL
jgi:hypothetical protein